MIKSDKEQYWKDRAEKYSEFKWANDEGYLNEFLNACEIARTDYVLDLGCGTGLVAKQIAPYIKRLIGMDNSRDMLLQCNGTFNLMLADAADNPFPDATFDKVIARNIFHHMRDSYIKGLKETRRVLRRGGRLIIGERVPPSDEVAKEYADMLALKDRRIVFTETALRLLLASYGFKVIKSFPVWINGFSVREWLEKSGLSIEIQEQIFDRHFRGSDEFKKAHNMKFTLDSICSRKHSKDVKIDIKNIIMIAEAR